MGSGADSVVVWFEDEAKSVERTEFGALLRARREDAGLSRRALAQAVGLSESTIKFVEMGRILPSSKTVARLAKAPLLRVGVAHRTPTHPAAIGEVLLPPSGKTIPHEQFERAKYLSSLQKTLRGAGGVIPFGSLFLASQSATAYLDYVRSSAWIARSREAMPMATAAQAIGDRRSGKGLLVIVLGIGDGQLEMRLIRNLVLQDQRAVMVWVIEINALLLETAMRQLAVEKELSRVKRLAMLADFQRPPDRLEYVTAFPHSWQRLVVVLGSVGYLETPHSLFKEVLHRVTRPSDLVLFDMPTGLSFGDFTPAETPLKEPAFRTFLRTPFSQMDRLPKRIVLSETQGQISTQVFSRNVMATVETHGLPARRFSVLREHHVGDSALHRLVSQCGFGKLASFAPIPEWPGATTLHLCQKVSV